jgi:hypothetical protein
VERVHSLLDVEVLLAVWEEPHLSISESELEHRLNLGSEGARDALMRLGRAELVQASQGGPSIRFSPMRSEAGLESTIHELARVYLRQRSEVAELLRVARTMRSTAPGFPGPR